MHRYCCRLNEDFKNKLGKRNSVCLSSVQLNLSLAVTSNSYYGVFCSFTQIWFAKSDLPHGAKHIVVVSYLLLIKQYRLSAMVFAFFSGSNLKH